MTQARDAFNAAAQVGLSSFDKRTLDTVILGIKETTDATLSAAGTNTQVQYNNNGDFGASANFTWTSVDDLLTVGGNLKLSATGSAATTDTGIYSPGADQLAISTGGNGRLFVNSSGNVGIGTTNVANRLTVVGPATNSAVAYLNGTDAANSSGLLVRAGGTNSGKYIARLQDAAANTRVEVLANGNVGIGTQNPGAALDIYNATSGDQLRISNATNVHYRIGRGTVGGLLEFYGTQSSNNGYIFGGADGERARIDSAGRLLVGTSSARDNWFSSTGYAGQLQVETNGWTSASITRNSASAAGPSLQFGKSRGTVNGAVTLVADGDVLGRTSYFGGDGTGLIEGARIDAFVDATPGTNDMPGRLVFSTTAATAASPTERMRITSDGYARLSANSGGIQFNGDTAAANALDDYEEGTWTPTIVGTSTAGTGTYSTQVGRYTKIGRQVYCVGALIWTAHTGTGNMRIEGLPFSSLNVSELFNAAVFSYVANITMPANSILMGDMPNNTSRINLRSVVTGGGLPSVLTIDPAGNLYFSITYQTN